MVGGKRGEEYPMKSFLPILALVCLLAPALRADDISGKSADGKLSFEIKNLQEISVWKTESPGQKVLLYKEDGIGVQSAIFSPDNVWIAVERGGSSLGYDVIFFKRDKGLDFKPVGGKGNDPSPADLIGSFALKTKGINENILDHSYLKPLEWGPKSEWLIVTLSGKGKYQGKITQVTNWHCRYNPVTHAIQPVKDNPGKIVIGAKE
jgi:hypothetical protein